jgi:Flp pilus assembly protein TadG
MKFRFNTFKQAVDGNVAMISAIAFPVVLMFGIGAVDYSIMSKSVQDLKQAASAAALAAVNEAQIAFAAKEDVDFEELMEETALRVFASRTEGLNFTDVKGVHVVTEQSGNRLTAKVNYSAEYSPQVMSLVGPSVYKISDSQRAIVSTTSYINISLLFDVSGSMGIGSTPADQELVAEATGCAFACHTNSSRGNSSYDRARANGATMRIDTAREAAINAVESIKSTVTIDDQVTFGLYKFSNEPAEIMSASDARSNDFNFVKSKIQSDVQMDIYGTGTNVELAMANMLTTIPASGTGRTEDDRVQYIVVLTDGVENTQSCMPGACWRPHYLANVNSPFKKYANHEINYAPSTAPCVALKAKGTRIYFINTEYIVPTTGHIRGHDRNRFDFIEETLHDLVDERMKDCTGSADQVVRTNTPQQIATAFEDVLGDVTSPLRLY